MTTATRVSFVVGGRSLAHLEVDGPILALPPQPPATWKTTHDVELLADEPVIEGAPDTYVGELPIVYWDPTARRPELARLDIPPPAPFAADDARAMWAEVSASVAPIPSSVPLQGRVAAEGRYSQESAILQLDTLQEALIAGLRLLRAWPTVEAVEIQWRGLELSGGREDVLHTERRGKRITGRRSADGKPLLDRTARRRATRRPWHSGQLAQAASRLASAVEASTTEHHEGFFYVVRLLGQIAAVAKPPIPRRDTPFSSWPSSARSLYRLLLRALAQVQAARGDSTAAPLSHLWELYEAWVGARTLATLAELLGRPNEQEAPSYARWREVWAPEDGTRVVALLQPRIAASGVQLDPRTNSACRSVSATLIPDVAIVVSSAEAERPVVTLLDAKKRTTATAMMPTDVAEAASKYVWGIRWLDETVSRAPFAVARVLVVSSAPAGEMNSPLSLIESIELRPTFASGNETLKTELRNAIRNEPPPE